MSAHALRTPHSSVVPGTKAAAKVERLAPAMRVLLPQVMSFAERGPKAAQQPHQRAEGSSALEHRTTTDCGPERSNTALLTDASSSLRCACGAANRER
jgi:hypothetical protein